MCVCASVSVRACGSIHEQTESEWHSQPLLGIAESRKKVGVSMQCHRKWEIVSPSRLEEGGRE